jgi:hypothetical protein
MAQMSIGNHAMEATDFTVAPQRMNACPPQGLDQALSCSMMT